MKPSERIRVLCDEVKQEWLGNQSLTDHEKIIVAMLNYLDEVFCDHKDSYQVDAQIGDIFYNVCNDCGILFLAKK